MKRVRSTSGPHVESTMSDAIRKPVSVPGETTLLWSADPLEAGDFFIFDNSPFLVQFAAFELVSSCLAESRILYQ